MTLYLEIYIYIKINLIFVHSYIIINIQLQSHQIVCHRIYESLNLSLPKWQLLVHVAEQFLLWQLFYLRVRSGRGW